MSNGEVIRKLKDIESRLGKLESRLSGAEFGGIISDDELSYYRLLCALTSPTLQHMQKGEFSWKPKEDIYAVVTTLLRYGGIKKTNYSGQHMLMPFTKITQFTSSDTIEGHNDKALLIYVLKSEVDKITDPRNRWYKRLDYIYRKTPKRYVVQNIGSGSHKETSDFKVDATHGALLKDVDFSGYEWDCTVRDASRERIASTSSVKCAFRESHEYREKRYRVWTRNTVLLPMLPEIDSVKYKWRGVVYGDDSDGWTSFGIYEVPNPLPPWW